MKLASSSRCALRHLAISLAVLVLAGAAAPCAQAAVQYTITDLGTLGGAGSYAYGINNSGQVVGYSYTNGSVYHAFLYADGSMTDLGSLGGNGSIAYGINDSGQVVGLAYDSGFHERAFLYSSGTMTDLGSFPGNVYSRAYGINNTGQVVGASAQSDGYDHAFLRTGGSMIDLGGGPYSRASGINDQGQVAVTGQQRAFLYSNGTMTDLGTLGGAQSQACGINNRGQVVGYSYTNGSVSHAFLYANGSMTDLGALGGLNSYGYGINNRGQIVGAAETTSGGRGSPQHAFIYNGGSIADLNNLTDPASGWGLFEARSINDFGQIVGRGSNSLGQVHAFLLTPFRTLFTKSVGTNLAISWFTNAPTPLSLFQNTDLTSANWGAVTNMPVVTNQMYQVTLLSASTGSCFFRLQSQ